MKKLLQFFMVLALVMIPSMCFAQREFPDGTVLNDKEEAVYEQLELQAPSFFEPASIRVKMVNILPDKTFERYKNGDTYIHITISAKNSVGGRVIKTYCWYKNGREAISWSGFDDMQDKDVDLAKLNHLWKTYHAEDD